MIQRYLTDSGQLEGELMAKFMNVVRYVVKADCHDEFIELHSSSVKKGDGLYGRIDGMLSQFLIKIGEYSYCFVAIWETESDLIKARPEMIEFLNAIRHMMEEISPELGVTDPVSGPVIFEQ